MNSFARKAMKVAALSFAALGLSFTLGPAAQAASLVTHDNWADGSGVVTDTSTQAPVSTCGNAISGAGVAIDDGCQGGADATTNAVDTILTYNNYGIASGLVANLDTQAPVDVSGNSTTVGGAASSKGSVGGANATIK